MSIAPPPRIGGAARPRDRSHGIRRARIGRCRRRGPSQWRWDCRRSGQVSVKTDLSRAGSWFKPSSYSANTWSWSRCTQRSR